MSRYGNDSKTCGSRSQPCQSISQAVRKVDYGGCIYLDGRGTEQHPYDCESRPTPVGYHQGIYINKSLTLKGFNTTPRVLCIDGFHFQKTNNEKQTLKIELSGIDFRQTPLTCNDCQQVTIHNCSFHDASRALAIEIQNITSFHLEIQGNSTFHKNSQCINLLLLDNIGNKSRFVTVTINGATFEKNGLYGRRRSERGVMKITSATDIAPLNPVYINIFFDKVNCFDNLGHFINLNVSSAVTNETYKQVELHRNKLSLRNMWLDMKPQLGMRSLYFSHARETQAKFITFSCHDNPSVQCIVVQSNRADIIVQDSTFYNQLVRESSGSCLSLDAIIGASLTIVNSSFHMNEAGAGGSLYANSTHGLLKIDLTNVIFRECKARYGCAISVGRSSKGAPRTQWGPQKLYFSLRNVTIEQWKGPFGRRKCIAVDVLLDSGVVILEESRFTKKTKTRGDGAFRVVTTGGKTNVTISRCTFKDTAVNATQSMIVDIAAGNANAGIVKLLDSFIVGNVKKKIALFISPKYRFKLVNVTFISFKYGLVVRSAPPKNCSQFPINIFIDNCTFVDNIFDMMLTLLGPTSVQVTIKNTLLTSSNETVKWDESSNSYAILLIIPPLQHVNFSKAVIVLDNNVFQSRPPSYIALLFEGDKNVTIRRSLFRNCINAYRREWINPKTGYFYETTAGAISILLNPDKPRNLGCVNPHNNQGTHPSWNYNSYVLFEDTTFVENLGMAAGAVYVSNGFTIFRRCTFRDNFGTKQSGHVYSAYGTGRVDFVHCSFLRTKESMIISNSSTYNTGIFLYSESGGPLKLENTSMTTLEFYRSTYPIVDISTGGYVDMDKTSRITCSEGQELLLENGTHFVYMEKNNSICLLNVTVLKYSCKSCPPGYYSLQTGVSEGLVVTSTAECHPCPFGATCIESNIAEKPHFWGYLTQGHPPLLQFIPCPEHYCPSTASTGYNSCHGNRNGTLCGHCAKGFTETLFSAECRKSTECNDYSVWIVTILLTMALALYLLIKPPILRILGNQILWFKKRGENQEGEQLDAIDDGEHSDSGYIKITFYFYQAAETVMVGPVEELIGKIPLIHFIISAYNFHIQSVNQGLGCPFAGLTAVTKELVLSVTVFLTMANVVVIYVVQLVINAFMGKEKPSLIHYMAVIMEVLLLGYERLAETSLKLMHCVSIGSGKWLFIDANVPCMQWWQYLLLAYIVIFVVPFIIVLYYGSSKLYRSFITAGEFLAACMVPLPFLIYWLVKEILKRRRGDSTRVEVVNNDVLEILHGPFRPPSGGDKGTLYWESVLIGRRLILLLCEAFIADMMLRMVSMATVCLLITLHHVLKNPYRNSMANKAETLSLVTLSVIAIINLTKATLMSFGITSDGPSKPYMEALEWFEVCALAFVPALVSILVTFAILSQLARFVLFLIKHFRLCWGKVFSHAWYMDEERRPLLDTAEQN